MKLVPIAVGLGHGMWIFLTFLVLYFFAVWHGYYTRTDSGINQRPYNGTSGDAPRRRDSQHDRARCRPARLLARHALTANRAHAGAISLAR